MPGKQRSGFRRSRSLHRVVMLLLILAVVSTGCAVAPQPEVDVHLEPVTGRFNAHIDPETRAATVEKQGIAVTLKPFHELDLFMLTEDPTLNPYLYIEDTGDVHPRYTVFNITVHNRKHRRVLVDDAAILMDGEGGQLGNLPIDYFDSLYAPQRQVYSPTPYPSYPYSYGGYGNSYVDMEALEIGRMMIEDNIFEGAKLFSGARRSGFLIFDRLQSIGMDVRVVIPHVRIVHPNGKEDKLEFKIDFRQVMP